jgi:hypothetical protein
LAEYTPEPSLSAGTTGRAVPQIPQNDSLSSKKSLPQTEHTSALRTAGGCGLITDCAAAGTRGLAGATFSMGPDSLPRRSIWGLILSRASSMLCRSDASASFHFIRAAVTMASLNRPAISSAVRRSASRKESAAGKRSQYAGHLARVVTGTG